MGSVKRVANLHNLNLRHNKFTKFQLDTQVRVKIDECWWNLFLLPYFNWMRHPVYPSKNLRSPLAHFDTICAPT